MKKALIYCVIATQLSIGFGQNFGGKKRELNTEKLSTQIDALVKQYQDLDIFSGVVLIADKGKPVYHKAFGLANRETKEANTLNTKFDIGSMNKTFTKVVILQLLEQGELKLTDKLGKYLTGFPKEAAELISIDHLLNHSSGYGDYYQSPDFFELPVSQKTIKALVERIRKMPLMFPPGEEQEYSNSGYILLGAIIEKVTGMTYHQNVKDRIVKPLGLSETYVEDKYNVPNRSIGYLKNMRGELEDNSGFVEMANPDGGFQSTATDVLTFYREFHYGEKLVKKKTKMKDEFFRMIQGHNTTGGAIPHAGGFNGANSVCYEILRDQTSVIVLANMDEPVAEQLGAGILAIIRGQEPKKPAIPAMQMVYQAYTSKGVDFVKKNFQDLIANFHPTDPKAFILNDIGYEFLFDGEAKKAIELFTLNTEMFPENPNVWDSLGEAHLENGDREKALKSYKKALSIDPYFPSAQKMVKELEGK